MRHRFQDCATVAVLRYYRSTVPRTVPTAARPFQECLIVEHAHVCMHDRYQHVVIIIQLYSTTTVPLVTNPHAGPQIEDEQKLYYSTGSTGSTVSK